MNPNFFFLIYLFLNTLQSQQQLTIPRNFAYFFCTCSRIFFLFTCFQHLFIQLSQPLIYVPTPLQGFLMQQQNYLVLMGKIHYIKSLWITTGGGACQPWETTTASGVTLGSTSGSSFVAACHNFLHFFHIYSTLHIVWDGKSCWYLF